MEEFWKKFRKKIMFFFSLFLLFTWTLAILLIEGFSIKEKLIMYAIGLIMIIFCLVLGYIVTNKMLNRK
ncbi:MULTISPECIES: hypothetical protein [Bacillus]|uniref:hypothetical protein n=1 Tax=Bacillus TaxID=1386 RepID=UPI0005A435EE|nr:MULTISPECIES: hypothetical protein [Bacillus]MBW4825660.1 hypothetical protein [Bacillaceae bacterium]MCY7783290.1 hypothetical protein [Bacillus sp. S20C3]MCY8205624.1 hypothetical protein [Bacillus sp. N12A5]MCY8287341.1 hypothetical protein [Bacillus sp. N13C7]MCY8639081.1 hypothetical protein [Bacillus sp. S17B2]MCY9144457.1 hypothetical protein [Bacillus sp. T9C1]MUG01333.1 hypothetical protein [Bacillus tequilensis]